MWALICDTNDGELRVVDERTALDEYLNEHKEVLLAMARLTCGREEHLDYAVCFLGS